MSLEDLERAGITLPRDQWGKRKLHSAVNRPLFLIAAAGAIGAGVLMYWGDGGGATWLGAMLFLVSFFAATAIALRAVAAQCRGGVSDEAVNDD
ncbi:MAG: hypothetical protein WBE26_08340 [Phycisphaerae bacterium]